MEIIKTKVTHYKVLRVLIDCMRFDEKFIKIRERFKYTGFTCFKCDRKHNIGEVVSLIFTDKGNKIVCRDCALEINRLIDTELAIRKDEKEGEEDEKRD